MNYSQSREKLLFANKYIIVVSGNFIVGRSVNFSSEQKKVTK